MVNKNIDVNFRTAVHIFQSALTPAVIIAIELK